MTHPHDHPAYRPELVTVLTHARLIDGDAMEHIYWRRNGGGLAPGLYVVSWPPGIPRRMFNEEARFVGPFATEQDAIEALAHAVARWMRQPPPSTQPPSHGAARARIARAGSLNGVWRDER
ncbi:MAG: hypothetical protein KJ025_04125 [Burkholderiales bacterium]|nr:hypothetical protein [Burkholderiales bacterium]